MARDDTATPVHPPGPGDDFDEATVELFRPIGQSELDRIRDTDYRAFPPRLPEQPIFYPVLNKEYATQIARDWNAKRNDPKVGYVTRFRVRASHLLRYEVHTVGASVHREYWIPAEELNEFNENIVGKIEIVAQFDGRADQDRK